MNKQEWTQNNDFDTNLSIVIEPFDEPPKPHLKRWTVMIWKLSCSHVQCLMLWIECDFVIYENGWLNA